MFWSNFSFTIFLLMSFPWFFRVFTDILKTYEILPNTCRNNIHLLHQFYVPTASGFWTILRLTLFKRCPRAQRTFLAQNFKKNYRYDIFWKCSAKRVLFCCIICYPYSQEKALHMNWWRISLDKVIQIWDTWKKCNENASQSI